MYDIKIKYHRMVGQYPACPIGRAITVQACTKKFVKERESSYSKLPTNYNRLSFKKKEVTQSVNI